MYIWSNYIDWKGGLIPMFISIQVNDAINTNNNNKKP